MLQKTQHIPSKHVICYARTFFQQRFILYSASLIRPPPSPSSTLHRASSSYPPYSLPSWPILLFYATTPVPLYTQYAYILQLVVKHRVPCLPLSITLVERTTTTPFGGMNVIMASEPVVACTSWQ